MKINYNGIDREMTAAEQTEYEQTVAAAITDMEQTAAEDAVAFEARKAPLRRLGLTEDEIDVVLGL